MSDIDANPWTIGSDAKVIRTMAKLVKHEPCSYNFVPEEGDELAARLLQIADKLENTATDNC